MSNSAQLGKMVKLSQQLIQQENYDDPRIEKTKQALAKSKNDKARKLLIQISLRQATGLARQKRYDDARAVLAPIAKHPAAAQLLEKINKADPPRRSSTRAILTLLILIVVVGGVLAATVLLNDDDDTLPAGFNLTRDAILATNDAILADQATADAAFTENAPAEDPPEADPEEIRAAFIATCERESASDDITEACISQIDGILADYPSEIGQCFTLYGLNTTEQTLQFQNCLNALIEGLDVDTMQTRVAGEDAPQSSGDDDPTREAIIATNDAIGTQAASDSATSEAVQTNAAANP